MTTLNFTVPQLSLRQHSFLAPHAAELAQADSKSESEKPRFELSMIEGILTLQDLHKPQQKPINSLALLQQWQQRLGSFRGKQEPLAKAFSLYKRPPGTQTHILDTTAGLGRDAIVLARLGANITMIEREPPLACLLRQALEFAQSEPWFTDIKNEIIIQHGDSAAIIQFKLQTDSLNTFTDYYCDPMFGHKKNKSANNKKLVQVLQHICHSDQPNKAAKPLANYLLTLLIPGQRLVIKRAPHEAKLTEYLNFQLSGRAFRLDVHFRPEL